MDNISNEAIQWLANGDRGISSNTIFSHLTGIDALGGTFPSHPHDPADFLRCEKLLTQVPKLRYDLYKMTAVSGYWQAIVPHWDKVRFTLLSEIGSLESPIAWNAPKTYALMQEIYKAVE